MKVLILWARIPSYLAGFCRHLEAESSCRVTVAGLGDAVLGSSDAPVSNKLYEGISTIQMSRSEISDDSFIRNLIESQRPDVLVVSGWQFPTYRRLYSDRRFAHLPIVLASDNTWRGTWKQRFGRVLLKPTLDRAAKIWIPGVRAEQLMRRYGVQDAKLIHGLYNVDGRLIGECRTSRDSTTVESSSRKFLFVGQLIERKGFDLLIDAYHAYRKQVSDPWELVVCGRGPLETLCACPGVDYRGFIDGADLPKVLVEADAFVLPSLYDAWGVVIAEAACAGLPIIATEQCGAVDDLLRDTINGFRIATGDVDAIAVALLKIHQLGNSDRQTMGRVSSSLADPFKSSHVAKRMSSVLKTLST
jgi:glycosyltransferase involved in cell wall biosynthesis